MYQLRVYSPIEGVTMLYADAYGWGEMARAEPLGTSKACINIPDVNSASVIRADLKPGYSVARWVVDIDGVKSSQEDVTCTINYSGSISNVQVRLEVRGSAPAAYSVTLRFNANGGWNAPGDITESSNSDSVIIVIPSNVPTRTGYFFAGWARTSTATEAEYSAGQVTSWWGTQSGNTYWLYAVWVKELTTSAYIWDYGVWKKATPYIWDNGGWRKATSHIWDNGRWKKGI